MGFMHILTIFYNLQPVKKVEGEVDLLNFLREALEDEMVNYKYRK